MTGPNGGDDSATPRGGRHPLFGEPVFVADGGRVPPGSSVAFSWTPPAGGPPRKGFVARATNGILRAWLNDCPHLGVPLDTRGGDFFEEDRRFLVCTFHGALFVPETGACVAGPCKGEALTGLACRERDGRIEVFDADPARLSTAGEVGAPQDDLFS